MSVISECLVTCPGICGDRCGFPDRRGSDLCSTSRVHSILPGNSISLEIFDFCPDNILFSGICTYPPVINYSLSFQN